MVIGGIVATTKTTWYCRGTSYAFFFFFFVRCWYLFYQFYPAVAWKWTQRKSTRRKSEGERVCGSVFALNVQCANKCIEIDEHLLVAKWWNLWLSPHFLKLKFIGIFAAVSLSHLSMLWNLMHTKWSTQFQSFEFFLSPYLFLSYCFFILFCSFSIFLFRCVCVCVNFFCVCSDFNFNPKLNWMWKIDAKIRENTAQIFGVCL